MNLAVRVFSCATVALAALSSIALPQSSNKEGAPSVPTVTFNVFWAAYTPQEYSICVTSLGSARYLSRNPTHPPDANGVRDEDYVLEFTMSEANLRKVFLLTEQANFFDGQFDYTKHAIASTGKKTLSYADAARRFHTTYNWSENAAIDQLTKIFGGISNTIEHGRKLQFLRRYDKLGLEAELKGVEHLAQGQDLAEIQIIAPILENIANDSAILNIARQRARRLLALAPNKQQ
jgi:hypothetical protein